MYNLTRSNPLQPPFNLRSTPRSSLCSLRALNGVDALDVEMGVDDGRRCSFVVRPRSPKSTITGPTALAVDLHGLLVREALAVVTQCLNFR